MAAALDTQKALTKEVHHRVKNNLQIILSLINLHSRKPVTSRPGHETFRTIQRRVEALAVVHRHLHAESESGRGIDLVAMLSELLIGMAGSLGISAQDKLVLGQKSLACVVQDVALPAAFFVTELAELANLIDPQASTCVDITRISDSEVELKVTSTALIGQGGNFAEEHSIYERVISGLARQLRREVVHDATIGRYALTIPTLAQDKAAVAA